MTANDHTLATLAQRGAFDTLIDARSPSEFAEDHIPGAINCPVLDDAQRALVGTLYKQASPFEARKVGAVLVARNVAQHIETLFADKPKHWKPLVYCWRGGQRSGAFTHILREVGWGAKRLQGGYKTWRHQVLIDLESLPGSLRWIVVAGPTGSGKTRVLEALQAQGHQVLDLEGLACHKGSVLGSLPGQPQPSQKMFETRVQSVLAACDPARPVFVESESKRVGQLRVPDALFAALQAGHWLRLEAPLEQRVQFLLRDYAYSLNDPALVAQLERLKELCGGETLKRWQGLVAAQEFGTLVTELLTQHYDRHYARSLRSPSAEAGTGTNAALGDLPNRLAAPDLSPDGIAALATQLGRWAV